MNKVNAIFDFCAKVVVTTFSQLVWLLGIIFVFGLLLYLFARFTRTTYVKSVGVKMDIIFTGWIGTPIHELGHALFCILFRHKIVDMKLYNPSPDDGTLGYVSHSYNPSSRYQKIGNFFIGIGPILFGALVLYALLYFLMPALTGLFSHIEQQSTSLTSNMRSGGWANLWNAFYASAVGILGGIFSVENLSNWRFWVFLYLSFCIASHMELSPPDIKGARGGLITFVLTILVLNFVIIGIETLGFHAYAGEYWQYAKLETYAEHINNFLGALGALLTYALIISGLNFVLSYLVLSVVSLVKGRGFFNPLWY